MQPASRELHGLDCTLPVLWQRFKRPLLPDAHQRSPTDRAEHDSSSQRNDNERLEHALRPALSYHVQSRGPSGH